MDEIQRTTDDVKGWKVGDVVRSFEGAYASATILGFSLQGAVWWAKVARPYVYAHDIGTPCSHPLMGMEIYEVQVDNLKAAERGLDGKPRNYLLAEQFVIETRTKVEGA